MISRTVTITNPSGLHARPASEFVAKAKEFQSKITIENITEEGQPVNAKSIILILTLGAGSGTQVEIAASGEDEKRAVDELADLIKSGFGE